MVKAYNESHRYMKADTQPSLKLTAKAYLAWISLTPPPDQCFMVHRVSLVSLSLPTSTAHIIPMAYCLSSTRLTLIAQPLVFDTKDI